MAAWVLFIPPDDGRTDFVRQIAGEMIASTAVVLFGAALLLSTRARWLEPVFGGLDKMYRSHRHAGTAGFLLLVLHVALIPWRLDSAGGVPSGIIAFVGIAILVIVSIGPRLRITRRFVTLNYRSWRRTHRLIGFFFIFSLAHMLLVDSLVVATPLPFTIVMAAFVVGIVSFLYVLLLARLVRPSRKYVVEEANRLNDTTLEILLTPRKKPLEHRSGQFVFVKFKGRHFREPHPFTVASSPKDESLRLAIKASGDFTRHLYENLGSGRRARVEGAYGMLDFRDGGKDQIWIAGGIGVTPFLSWLEDIESLDRHINFFYTVRHADDALFVDDIFRLADQHDNLEFHLTVSSQDGSLTVDRVVSSIPHGVAGSTVYMCGPVGMINAFEQGLAREGVDQRAIHYEEFSFR